MNKEHEPEKVNIPEGVDRELYMIWYNSGIGRQDREAVEIRQAGIRKYYSTLSPEGQQNLRKQVIIEKEGRRFNGFCGEVTRDMAVWDAERERRRQKSAQQKGKKSYSSH